jgi:cell division protein FtsQ
LGVLLLAGVVGALAGGRVLLLHSARFHVTEIAVAASPGIDVDEVRAATGIPPATPLLAVDLAEIRRRVETLPEVASVQAVRKWPSTVALTVTERTPVALASSPGGPRLVDRTGMAYLPAPPTAPELPRLAAARVAPGDPATEAGLAVLASLTPAVREKLRVVEAAGPAAVTLRLAGGQQVRWGSPDGSARKAAVLSVLMTQHGSVYDVSAPDLPTIRR